MRDDRGAVLIHVAFALLGLMAFTAFVIDYGVFWTSRRQAQNAADAAALSGAVALSADQNDTAAQLSATTIGSRNRVWGEAAVIQASFPTPCQDGTANSTINDRKCIRVDVYRDQSHGNPLPMFFGALFLKATQGVRATATAKVAAANGSDCIRPLAVLDKAAPGYSLADVGTQLVIKDDAWPGGPSSFRGHLNLGQGNGTAQERDWLLACGAGPLGIGEYLVGSPGNANGVKHAIDDLIDLDPFASVVNGAIVNSCVQSGTCYRYVMVNGNPVKVAAPQLTISPRVIPLPIIALPDWNAHHDPDALLMKNIMGFFIVARTGGSGQEITGTIVTQPGLLLGGAGNADPTAAFLQTIVLIR